MTVESLWM